MSSNRDWFNRALDVLPGGVDSPVRSFRSVGGTPFTVARGEGAYVYDVEGTKYIDFVQSYGASILGHAAPEVVGVVCEQAKNGTTFGAPTTGEVLLAEAMTQRVEGLEQVRFVSSGTEALMSVIRLARGHVQRDKIVKFDGCYHGHSDALLVAGGSGVAQMGLPDSAGVTKGSVADTIVVPYNEVPTLSEEIAAVVVEPVAANMNLVAPVPGFLEGLRSECDRVGALLIFDEVITGFRLRGGGATEYFGIRPDLWCFGKVIGGGLPVGAFGGGKNILSSLAPLGPVYQAGTLSGNPLAMAAGLAVLERVGAPEYEELARRVHLFADGLAVALRDEGIFALTPHVGSLAGLFLSREEVTAPQNFEEAKRLCDNGLYKGFFHEMLKRGVALAPGSYEIMFLSLAHNDGDLSRSIDVAIESARAMKAVG